MSDVAKIFERPVLAECNEDRDVQRMRVSYSAGHVIQKEAKSTLHK